MNTIKLTTPLTDEVIASLHAGDMILVTGILYTARDAAHKKMIEELKKGGKLPFDIKGQILYYVGPTPAKEGQIIGSAGPTTASRMDSTTEPLLALGLKATIGKGGRTKDIKPAFIKYKAIHMATIGGAGVLLARQIKKVEMIAYEDLGTEAIRKLTVENFPAFVINDIYGNDYYEIAKEKFAVR